MKTHASTRRKLAGGSGIVDLVMTILIVAGIGATIVGLNRLTPLPFWACCVLGLPLFLGAFWAILRFFFRRRE